MAKKITSITDSPKQRFTVDLDDNKGSVEFAMYFKQTQKSWYYDFVYNNYESYGNKAVLNPNALRYLRKTLPFGIMFASTGNIEPYAVNDFSTGRIEMIILNEADVEQVEEAITDVD